MDNGVPDPSIMIRLYGPGIKPETVSVRVMADLVQAIQSLSGTKLHLMKVKRRSAGYLLSADDNAFALKSLAVSGKALAEPESYLSSSMLSAFDTITSILRKLDCKLEIRTTVDQVYWRLDQSLWPTIRQRSVITDEATIIGTLQRLEELPIANVAFR